MSVAILARERKLQMPAHNKKVASLGTVSTTRPRNGHPQWRAQMATLGEYGPLRLRQEHAGQDLAQMRAAPTRADVSRIAAELRAEAVAAYDAQEPGRQQEVPRRPQAASMAPSLAQAARPPPRCRIQHARAKEPPQPSLAWSPAH